ncbi:MAG: proline--tRNA ligase [Dehalococcoidia bacterium]|nr:proline--tRNA ligase [Dehalococcoidia bacterium]
MTRLFGHTRRERTDADTENLDLLLRAGFIDQLAAGSYTYMPLGYRTKRKVEAIVRQEMDRAGAQEVFMPAIQPSELWEQSGRYDVFGATLFRVTDRRERALVLAPTHEEVITRLFRDHAQSYRDLPATLYQIQTKFRDEARPRGGLIRVREFTMKDAYSFDMDEAGLDASYTAMFEAYRRIFARCGVPTVPVEADSGAIGGKGSQEFIFIADIGEDTILICNQCGYAANTEKAEFVRPATDRPAGTSPSSVRGEPGEPPRGAQPAETPAPEPPLPTEEIATPGTSTIEALAQLLGIPASRTAKAVLLAATNPHHPTDPPEAVFAVIRGDLDVNEIKLSNALGGRELAPLTEARIRDLGAVPGYASPIGLERRFRVVADTSIMDAPNLVAGANREGYHLRNVNVGRDWEPEIVTDIALGRHGHTCARCGTGTLEERRGIEMGHVFRLGTIYTQAFEVNVLAEDGARRTPIMGCYGIGVDRIVAAAVEANHDDSGIRWPAAIAPYEVHLVALGASRDPAVATDADALYEELRAAGIEVLYDDRDESAGVKFNDADLIGLPFRLTVSSRNLKDGLVEVQPRGSDAARLARSEVTAHLVEQLTAARTG